MSIIRALLAGFLSVALVGLSGAAQADGLDSIMKAKVIKVAVPQDFAPFGSAGTDLKPQGLDIDMANLIAKELGVKVEIVAGDQRQPHSLSADQEGRPGDLQPRQERRARKGDRFLRRLRAVLPGVFGAEDRSRSRRPDDLAGKTIGATRGAIEEQEITKIAPSSATIKRYEDNNATISAFVSGQVRSDRHRQRGRRRDLRQESAE